MSTSADHPDRVDGPDDAGTDHDDVERRAELLPEERAVGSDDPEEQARVILAESQERTEDPGGTRHASVQSPD
jgi:hypothetical protein